MGLDVWPAVANFGEQLGRLTNAMHTELLYHFSF